MLPSAKHGINYTVIRTQNNIIRLLTLEAIIVNILLFNNRPPVDVTSSSVLLACAL